MQISELSRVSGVPIPTLKFYLREGLLPPGRRTAATKAQYSEHHLRRLRLIRTLTEIGSLSLRSVRSVLKAVDNERLSLHDVLGVASYALDSRPDSEDSPEFARARKEVDQFLTDLRWRVDPNAPSRRILARALVSLRRAGRDVNARIFLRYARLTDRLAAREVSRTARASSRTDAVERVIIGNVVFEAALVALRRLAQEHHSALRYSKERRSRQSTRRTSRR